MIYLYYLFAALLIYMSYRSFRGGQAYLEYFRHELEKPGSSYTPFSTIIVPCKGLDDGLEDNLLAILQQEYPRFEVVFVVDSKDDAACITIEVVMQKTESAGIRSKMVVAPLSVESSQKVENLRTAVLHASDESEIFVFVDSDTRPKEDWLRSLIAPLKDASVGASTG